MNLSRIDENNGSLSDLPPSVIYKVFAYSSIHNTDRKLFMCMLFVTRMGIS